MAWDSMQNIIFYDDCLAQQYVIPFTLAPLFADILDFIQTFNEDINEFNE